MVEEIYSYKSIKMHMKKYHFFPGSSACVCPNGDLNLSVHEIQGEVPGQTQILTG